MNDRTPPASATLEPADLHAAPALDLLAPGAGVPPRYRQVFAQLQDWGLPADLAQLGLLMRRVERGAVAPAQIEPVLGPRAAAAAASLADLASAPRPSLRHVERV